MRHVRLAVLFVVFVLALPLPLLATQPPQTVVIEGVRAATDAAYNMGSFYYVPFEVPQGVTTLTIDRQLSIEPSGSVSLGTYIFDPRGTDFINNGFRGHTDAKTGPIVITANRETTTRRFYHGPIQPGRWYIGQHFKSRSKEVERVVYRYTITFSFDGPTADAMPQVTYDPVVNTEPGWYAVDLHSHTVHSDGRGTLDEVAGVHATQRYDAMNNTDHNITTAQFEFAEVGAKYPNMLLLAGEEISTTTGHANVIGGRPGNWYDPRMVPGDGRLPRLIRKIHSEDALFSLNHPFARSPLNWNFPAEEWAEADAMEVFQGGGYGGDDRQSTDLWDSLLKAGRHITGVGGTDTHGNTPTLKGFTWVWAENLSRQAIVDGIRKGRVFISYQRTGPLTYISVPSTPALPGDTVRIGDEKAVPVRVRVVGGKGMNLRLVWQDGETTIPVDKTFFRTEYPIPVGDRLLRSYVRAEVQRSDGVVFGLTNPIYIVRESGNQSR